MLQQTQVKTVLPRYHEWFDVFPDIKTLTATHIDDVFKQWEGLGYYRRARFIHEAAQHIMQNFDGVFPTKFEDILSLKGVGRSTAGAIASFCFQAHTPVLDGNVKRVLSSWENKVLTDKELWLIAQDWIDQTDKPDLWNQAMMELGATLCGAKKRDCAACPVRQHCLSAFTEPPQKAPAARGRHVHWQVYIYRHPQRGIWLEQRPQNGIWAGLWTPPIRELDTAPNKKPAHIHRLTHRTIHLYVKIGTAPPQGNGQWFASWDTPAIPTGIHRLLSKTMKLLL